MFATTTTIQSANAYIAKVRREAEEQLASNHNLSCIVIDNGEVIFSPDYSDETIESIAEDFGFINGEDGEWYDPLTAFGWDEELAEELAEAEAEADAYRDAVDAAWRRAK